MNKYDKYDEMAIAELAAAQRDLRDQIDDLAARKTALQKEFDFVRQNKLPAAMEAAGIENVKIAGVGRVSIQEVFSCSVKAAHKYDMQQWLKDNDFEDMIVATVNSSTLKAFVKEQMGLGNEVPTEYLNLSLFPQATITKG